MGRVDLPAGRAGGQQLVWRTGDEMNDEPLNPLAMLMIGGILCGCLLLVFGAAPLTNWSGGTQNITISSVAAADNCEAAGIVGNGACNQTVAVVDFGSLVFIGLGLFLVFGWIGIGLLFAVL
jgi:hypothetical protein